MPASEEQGLPIAVVSSGQAGMAALIAAIVEAAYETNDGEPKVTVLVFDTGEAAKVPGGGAYPLDGRDPSSLHPFADAVLPTGFPTFGEYVKEMAASEPDLENALVAPTNRQIDDYLQYVLELATSSFAELITLEPRHEPIRSIVAPTSNGPATITLVDGTTIHVRRVVRGNRSPYLIGPLPGAPAVAPAAGGDPASAILLRRVRDTLAASGVAHAPASTLPDDDLDFLISWGGKGIAVAILDSAEADLHGWIEDRLLPRLEPIGASQLWIITATTVPESIRSRFGNRPVQFADLDRFNALLERIKSLSGRDRK